jgi:hypothetical protein
VQFNGNQPADAVSIQQFESEATFRLPVPEDYTQFLQQANVSAYGGFMDTLNAM